MIRTTNKIRRAVLPKLHPLDGVIGMNIPPSGKPRALLRERGVGVNDEYTLSVSCSYDKLVDALSTGGYSNNWLSTLKYVSLPDGRSYEVGSMAYREYTASRYMHHAYWFVAAETEYTFHIGHHKERNYFDIPTGISEHTQSTVDGERVRWSGDPDGVLRETLESADIEYDILNKPEYRKI